MNLYRALKYRNCRLFFPGLLLSQIGIWYQNIAISWILLEITKSPFLMGSIIFCNAIPLFILTPISGVITDRYNKKQLMVATQILFLIQALCLIIVSTCNLLNIFTIIILGLMLNCTIAIDTPLRQSIFANLVDDKKDLSNAIALNSACFNMARLIGPAAAGVILSVSNPQTCFIINFLFTIPAAILISMLNINTQTISKNQKTSIFNGIKEGIRYVKENKTISIILRFLTIISLIGMTYPVLIPIHTKITLNSNSDILGYLMAATGFGALFSSFVLASKSSITSLKNTMLAGILIFGISFIFIGMSNSTIFSIITSFLLGAGMTASITGINTIIQSLAQDNKRGRLMSLYTICYLGSAAISNIFAGTISEYFGISKTFIMFGCILTITALLLHSKLKEI